MSTERTRINHQIRASELRVIDEAGNNLGVISLKEALEKALSAGLDLIEISGTTIPPIAKIMDYGKFQYDQNKKQRSAKSKAHTVLVKALQITIGTGEHDLELKAKKASEWLKEGHRIKIDLFLRGRAKYMDINFLKDRIERMLRLITENYKIADSIKKSPKGLSVMIEKA
ncbi:MAG: translation initiation factor IF-3 [Candidatus Taylorbacteria bacterium RIFCSPHIGHO2_02_FULL_45_35]|uniref:Translation initiation factor IF-3 n=1 Tax=Candidatus Taylorbacteria bacterium RIFCSPHIGHO2_02_FULL_45_35 TaxID=1802311 RepID=A0A1G2MU44_9BACT|nr:MAG: translation initiation factor IF-3 [Candidatus Taylorbacteria bacterium RIFCSPHIGHO2_02_FULL_45_35]